MPRRSSARQAAQNRAFLAALARTGNARLAALVLGVHRATYLKRRARDPAFAAAWAAALAQADAALASPAPAARAAALDAADPEPVVVRTRGRHQLRRARPGQITRAGEDAFCRALAASANKRLSAARAGFAHSSFHRRARLDPAFAARVREALDEGWHRVFSALYQSFDLLAGPQHPEDEEDWDLRTGDCPLPPMTVEQAILLLRYHESAIRRAAEERHRR